MKGMAHWRWRTLVRVLLLQEQLLPVGELGALAGHGVAWRAAAVRRRHERACGMRASAQCLRLVVRCSPSLVVIAAVAHRTHIGEL